MTTNRGVHILIIILLAISAVWAGSGPLRRPVSWVKINPGFAGATFVNDSTKCAACHEESTKTFEHTMHARALGSEGSGAGKCESCHGPRSKHIDDPKGDLAFEKFASQQQSSICLQCHEGGSRFGWKSGAHRANDVSCTSCHVVMKKNTERALLAKKSGPETCYQCHREVRPQMMKVSHHPVREGLMRGLLQLPQRPWLHARSARQEHGERDLLHLPRR